MLKNTLETLPTATTHLQTLDLPAKLTHRLQTLAASAKVAHLWVFISPTSEMATSVARAFLLDWLASPPAATAHPDLIELRASGKVGLHSIASIRQMLEQLSLTPHGSKGRAVLVDAADRMLASTANALLKALEEPPPSTVIILTSSSPHLILPTILSRAQTIRFPGAARSESGEAAPLIDLLRKKPPVSYSALMSACAAVQKEFEQEQTLLAKQLAEKKADETGDLSAAAKQEMASEADAGLTLWSQSRAKQILEDMYLALREPLSAEEGSGTLDPAKLTQLLLQAMNGIDRGSDLSTMALWFASQVCA